MATRYLEPAAHESLPASQWRQVYHGGSPGGHSAYGTGGGGAIVAADLPKQIVGVNGPAEISLTPVFNCFWVVDAQAIWRAVGASWIMMRTIIQITPADLDGKTFGKAIDAQHHNAIDGYAPTVHSDTFRLQAGVAYQAEYWMNTTTVAINGFVHWTGSPYLRIEGHTYGHGSF